MILSGLTIGAATVDRTPNLDLPYILPSQAQKHVTHNEAIRALDAIAQAGILSRSLQDPPEEPAEGDRYIVATEASGDWSGHDLEIAAWQDGAWMFYPAKSGWVAWINDEDVLVVWDDSSWLVAGGTRGEFDSISVNGAAGDAVNRIAANAPATLLNHDGNGHQLKVNKNAVADTASVLFQTSFSGRAEFGLTGDDDWHVKVSPDGSTWYEAIVADKDTGNVGIGTSAPKTLLDIADDSLRLRSAKTPASESDTGIQGQIAWDSDYIHVCTDTDTWKRAALGDWSSSGAAQGSGAPDAVIEERYASGTHGGSALAGTSNPRNLNTVVRDFEGLITLSNGRFTPSVDGWVEFRSEVYSIVWHKALLYNVTDGVYAGYGSPGFLYNTVSVSGDSAGGCAVLAGKLYELHHYTSNARATTGLGYGTSLAGVPEIYARTSFWRI